MLIHNGGAEKRASATYKGSILQRKWLLFRIIRKKGFVLTQMTPSDTLEENSLTGTQATDIFSSWPSPCKLFALLITTRVRELLV